MLATIGFAGNARYTETIWIDLRDAPGGPAGLILDELSYWINVIALTFHQIMKWFIQALLLYHCFIIWNWQTRVVVPTSTLFAVMVAHDVHSCPRRIFYAIFYVINSQLAYLCLRVELTIVYTLLVPGRLFSLRKEMRGTLGTEHIRPYETAVIMVVESSALYSVFGIILCPPLRCL